MKEKFNGREYVVEFQAFFFFFFFFSSFIKDDEDGDKEVLDFNWEIAQ